MAAAGVGRAGSGGVAGAEGEPAGGGAASPAGGPRQRDGSTAALTVAALVAFASNSILCRLALGAGAIDPASFATVRIISGAAALQLLVWLSRRRSAGAPGGHWISALTLFLYAATFSFAYVSIGAGTGALILFGSVQATMIVAALVSGERFQFHDAAGLLLAVAGLVHLVSPGLSAPSPVGSLFMAAAGIAWGFYTLRGRGAADPLNDTAGNFIRSMPLVAAVSVATSDQLHATGSGLLLAAASGALASGVGYVAWYAALRGLSAIRAATVQLAVPALTAAGGVAFLGERLTIRLLVSAALILGGVALAVATRATRVPRG
jgi:drug/metabolite transporter (DMT)-like permease